ncbi:MAG: ABC transporter ATP-binding protein [Desulfurococcales archaeon]|nr:ABC transporter ATP-binding protein [Desulfurococcales archaeon]
MSPTRSLGVIRSIELSDVEVVYGGRVRALEVEKLVFSRAFYVVMGPNGAGKTTLLDVVSGLVLPSRGRVIINDLVNLSGLGGRERAAIRRDHYSYLLQEDIFMDAFSVWDNIALPYRLHGIEVPERRIRELAELLGIARLLDKRPSSLSSGERRKASLVRVLSKAPGSSVILLDEPTSFLDRESVAALLSFMESELQDKIVIVATHDEAVRKIADYTVKLRGGRVELVEKQSS